MNTGLALIFLSVSNVTALPPGLLNAVCFVESKHDVKAVNRNDAGSASLGVCQIKLSTARQLGYHGTVVNLQKPDANIFWAGLYLKRQLSRYDGRIDYAVAAYNSGTVRFNPQGLIMNRKYVKKVMTQWESEKLASKETQ